MVAVQSAPVPAPLDVHILHDSSTTENQNSRASNSKRIKKATKKGKTSVPIVVLHTDHLTLIANNLLVGMSYTIDTAASGKDGDHPDEEAKMKAAFGPNWRNNIDSIKTTAKGMREQTLKVKDANPETFDRESSAKGKVITSISKGKQKIADTSPGSRWTGYGCLFSR
jgi:hypothetical protein